jgi:hypothetical protein
MMLGNYRVAAQLVASRVVLSSTELVSLVRRKQGLCEPEQTPCRMVNLYLAGNYSV